MATLSTFFDMVYVYATETSGHGPFTLGAAVTGFQTAASSRDHQRHAGFL